MSSQSRIIFIELFRFSFGPCFLAPCGASLLAFLLAFLLRKTYIWGTVNGGDEAGSEFLVVVVPYGSPEERAVTTALENYAEVEDE